MYEEILQGLYAGNELAGAAPEEQFEYLCSLQASVKKLRSAYRAGTVSIDYADKLTQAAYLIAYFPHYTEPMFWVFTKHGLAIPARLSVFGGGPGPETIGLLRYISDHHPNYIGGLAVKIYDSGHDGWDWSRTIVRKFVVPTFQGKVKCAIEAEYLDISRTLASRIESPHFCVFQNCFNEVPHSASMDLHKNIISLYESLSEGSWLCMIHTEDGLGIGRGASGQVLAIEN